MEKSRTFTVPGSWAFGKGAQSPVQARDTEEQISIWFCEHSDGVYRYLAGAYGLDDDAEEVTQEAFLRLYEAMGTGEYIENPRAWVFTVARRLMLNRRKSANYDMLKRREFARVMTHVWGRTEQTPETALTKRRRKTALKNALLGLSETERQCLYARAQGLKLRQIGELVGMDLRRVAELIDRAVTQLQRHVDA